MNTPNLRATVGAVLAILAAISLTVIVDNGPDENGRRHTRVTIHVDGPDRDAKRDDVVTLSPKAVDVKDKLVEAPGDLRADKPGAPPLAGAGPQIAEGIIPAPFAADEIEGCRTRFLSTNFSARGVPLSKVIIFELHYTAGPDVPNSRADVDGLTAFGNRASSRVSWHFNVDKDGNCDYNVPLRLKAWTIAGLNPYTINVEVAGKGEAPYLRAGGYRKLALILEQVRQAYPGIKLALAATDGNCHPTRGGIDSHYRGGACSGGHTDIKPLDLAGVIATIRRYSAPAGAAAGVVADCRHVAKWRKAYPRGRGSSSSSRAHIRGHLAHAKRAGYDCPKGSSRPKRR